MYTRAFLTITTLNIVIVKNARVCFTVRTGVLRTCVRLRERAFVRAFVH